MNDPKDFLSRWSRLKREAADVQPGKTGGGQAGAAPVPGGAENQSEPVSEPVVPGQAEFDVSSLPPIESIDASTDISAFMQAGVPSALRHAALRRVWSADPAIRDFMGPTENFWDAAGPDGIPGFGELDPGLDVKRLVSELFGETVPEKAKPELPVSPSASENNSEIIKGDQTATTEHAPATTGTSLSHRTENGAPQQQPPQTQPGQKTFRRHGGAMPE